MNVVVIVLELPSLSETKHESQLYYIKFIYITLYYIIILFRNITSYINFTTYLQFILFTYLQGNNGKLKLELSRLWQLDNSSRIACERD